MSDIILYMICLVVATGAYLVSKREEEYWKKSDQMEGCHIQYTTRKYVSIMFFIVILYVLMKNVFG